MAPSLRSRAFVAALVLAGAHHQPGRRRPRSVAPPPHRRSCPSCRARSGSCTSGTACTSCDPTGRTTTSSRRSSWIPARTRWLQGAYDPDWSPDGTQILFLDSVHPGWPIMIANADGSDVHEVVPCDEGCQVLHAPAWSPDGRSIAYARVRGRVATGALHEPVLHRGAWTSRPASQRTVVSFDAVPGEPATMYDYPRWSPDGTSLVIRVHQLDGAQTEPHGEGAIAVVDAQGPGPRTPRILTDWNLWATYPDWSRTEDLIVFHERAGRSRTSHRTCTRSTPTARASRS